MMAVAVRAAKLSVGLLLGWLAGWPADDEGS